MRCAVCWQRWKPEPTLKNTGSQHNRYHPNLMLTSHWKARQSYMYSGCLSIRQPPGNAKFTQNCTAQHLPMKNLSFLWIQGREDNFVAWGAAVEVYKPKKVINPQKKGRPPYEIAWKKNQRDTSGWFHFSQQRQTP